MVEYIYSTNDPEILNQIRKILTELKPNKKSDEEFLAFLNSLTEEVNVKKKDGINQYVFNYINHEVKVSNADEVVVEFKDLRLKKLDKTEDKALQMLKNEIIIAAGIDEKDISKKNNRYNLFVHAAIEMIYLKGLN